MKEIPLSKKGKKNKGKYVVMVDDEDFERLGKFNWYALPTGNSIYAAKAVWINKKKSTVFMHRYILRLVNSNEFCDHKDHDGLNNQKSNLRTCSLSENNSNRRRVAGGTSKYLGVFWCKYSKAWYAACVKKTTKQCKKSFATELEAALEYDNMARELHGEFANLNFK